MWLQNEAGHDEHSPAGTRSRRRSGTASVTSSIRCTTSTTASPTRTTASITGQRGIAGRGVLADVGRWREAQGRPLQPNKSDPIEADDLVDARGSGHDRRDGRRPARPHRMDRAGTDRTTNAGRALASTPPDIRAAGCVRAETNWKLLWNLHISAVGVDNPSVEVWPPAAFVKPEELAEILSEPRAAGRDLHAHPAAAVARPAARRVLRPRSLAEDCAADGVYEFFFTSAPLNLKAGVASPPNALAIK